MMAAKFRETVYNSGLNLSSKLVAWWPKDAKIKFFQEKLANARSDDERRHWIRLLMMQEDLAQDDAVRRILGSLPSTD